MPWSRFWVVSHWANSPRSHIQQCPHEMLNGMTTRSPTARSPVSEPTSSTIAHRLVAEDVALVEERAEHLVEVQVGAADRGAGDAHDRVGRCLDRRDPGPPARARRSVPARSVPSWECLLAGRCARSVVRSGIGSGQAEGSTTTKSSGIGRPSRWSGEHLVHALGDLVLRLARHARAVDRHGLGALGQRAPGVVGRGGLRVPGVARVAREVTGLDRLDQGVAVDDGAAGGVHQPRALASSPSAAPGRTAPGCRPSAAAPGR